MQNLNKMIDHTLLKAFATEDDIKRLCEEAKEYNFKSVCVNPANVKLVSTLLKGSEVLVCTVIGFPLGANTKEVKMLETIDAIRNGADEIDMVINVGKAKEHDYKYIEDEKVACTLAARRANANFVKTSTGFGTGGALITDIITMKSNVSENMEVKASGGIRSLEDALAMIKAGATRIGTSNGVKIMDEYNKQGEIE